MNKQHIRACIVTRSISLADGLDALLGAIPQIDEIGIARSMDEAWAKVGSSLPQLVLIDAALAGNQLEEFLEKIVSLSPETQRILLVDDIRGVNWMPQYAEAVLIKGVSPSAVAAIVTNLLLSKGD